MTCDREGPLFSTWGPSNRLGNYVRRHPDGKLEALTLTDHRQPVGSAKLCADPSESIAYVVDNYPYDSGRVSIRRIEGNVIDPVQVTLPGYANEYLARWWRLFVGLLVAWVIHEWQSPRGPFLTLVLRQFRSNPIKLRSSLSRP